MPLVGTSLRDVNYKNTIHMEQYRKSPRAKFLDYDKGNFFVTICTKERKHYFGEIYNGEMNYNVIGEFAALQLSSASDFCREIDIPLFVVMPNHIHAIITVNRRDMSLAFIEGDILQRNPNPALRGNPTCPRHVPTLSRYISSFKGVVTKFAKLRNHDFGWQSRYYDHYIRGNYDGNIITEYILSNVAKWQEDCFFKT